MQGCDTEKDTVWDAVDAMICARCVGWDGRVQMTGHRSKGIEDECRVSHTAVVGSMHTNETKDRKQFVTVNVHDPK